MGEPTKSDKERAARYLPSHPHLAGTIAQAIADERARLAKLADHFQDCPSADANETNTCPECREWLALEFAHMRDQRKGLDHGDT